MVNAIGDVFSERISKVSPDANAVTVTVWESGTVPDSPVSLNIMLNILLGLVLDTAPGTALVFLLEFLDNSRRSLGLWKLNTALPDLGTILHLAEPKEAPKNEKESAKMLRAGQRCLRL